MQPSSTTQLLLEKVITGATTPTGAALSAFDILSTLPSSDKTIWNEAHTNQWNGYLIPPTSDTYIFSTSFTAYIALGSSLHNLSLETMAPGDLSKEIIYCSDPITLSAGTVYPCTIIGGPLRWQSARSPRADIPTSALLPAIVYDQVKDLLVKLSKVSIIIATQKLSDAEIAFWNSPSTSGKTNPRLSLQSIDLAGMQRLYSYCNFRNGLPSNHSNLLDLFAWAALAPDKDPSLAREIAKVTSWNEDTVTKLIVPNHFNLNSPSYFQDEIQLLKLQTAVTASSRIGVDVDKLFDWAAPLVRFRQAVTSSQSIQKTIRGRFTQSNWEKVIQPLNNIIRENSKNALISYLLTRPELHIKDADELFEFFLIDVQMSSCLQTSRIKQAISTVQLYIQRCLLGLEGEVKIDTEKWETMESQTLYVARRRVFLYPENWLQESLRDHKTPVYQELESCITQNDVTAQSAAQAIKKYLSSLCDIGNLQVQSLYWDGTSIVHIFARSPNPPFIYYYRTYNTNNTWTPWETMSVDIPNYSLTTQPGEVAGSGTYLTPLIWNRRLFVLFPQFTKVTDPATIKNDPAPTTVTSIGNSTVNNFNPDPRWQIQLCWTELRDGTWIPKQICETAIYTSQYVAFGGPYHDLDSMLHRFIFVWGPGFNPPRVEILQLNVSGGTESASSIGQAQMVNGNVQVTDTTRSDTVPITPGSPALRLSWTFGPAPGRSFQFQQLVLSTGIDFWVPSLAAAPDGSASSLSAARNGSVTRGFPFIVSRKGATTKEFQPVKASKSIIFDHPYCDAWLGSSGSTNLKGLENLKGLFASFQKSQLDLTVAFGIRFNELTEPYSAYNWELMFHAPMELVNQLRLARQYDQALSVLQCIFDPRSHGSDINSPKTTQTSIDPHGVWKFPPFKLIVASADTLETFFQGLSPGNENSAITDWRRNPFSPFGVARSRPVAFMKWVVMTYIGILIDYGDYYFRQNTLESVPSAIQMYVMASHLFGPTPQAIPNQGKIQAETYESLLGAWDAFDNAVVHLELAFPFSNQIAPAPPFELTGVTDTPKIFGSATSRYFCIPNNPELVKLRSTIDDRLYKIRHCQDINGVSRSLSLWEPPLDVSQLVAAAAAGLSVASVLNDLNTPLPNFRFTKLFDSALGMVSQLRSLGDSFLSVKEKKDGEALRALQAQQDAILQDLFTATKQSAIAAAKAAMETLNQQRAGAVQRMTHYLRLTGDDKSIIPSPTSPFSEVEDDIDAPTTDGRLRLSPGEKDQLDLVQDSGITRAASQILRLIAAGLVALPDMTMNAAPVGVGVSTRTGFPSWGESSGMVSDGLLTISDLQKTQSESAGIRAGHLRTLQDRRQIINEVGFQITTIDKKIGEQQLRITIANQDLIAQKTAAANSHMVQTFLQNKYSNVALYTWMETQVRSLYYQTYTLAYDLAKCAETAYHFERPQDTQKYIQYGYWDSTHDGLFCGDRLYSGLQQLSSAYRQQRGWDYELSKHISLKRLDPVAWLQLRESGSCQFDVPEISFDLDFPGHYYRRLKSVDITIPCVVGPYAQANCTLRLLRHQYRISAAENSPNDYEERTGDDERFRTSLVPISSIAISSGVNDAGVFELSFQGERYMPFEGAGVISTWQLDLPKVYQQFDYSTITDVIIHFNYTSLDGGPLLTKAATKAVETFVSTHQESRDLYTIFDIPAEFPEQWESALNPPAGATSRNMVFKNMASLIPIYRMPSKTVQAYVQFFSSDQLGSPSISVDASGTPTPANDIGKVANILYHYSTDAPITLTTGQTWQVTMNTTSKLNRVWMLVRYWYGK